MSSDPKPRLVIIVSDGPLMLGKPKQLSGRKTIHVSIGSPPLPPAAIATSIATGVSPLLHGIVTKGMVDSESLQIRETEAKDLRFQPFWINSGLQVQLINWPATVGDEEVTNQQSFNEFELAHSLLDSDIVGIVLPRLSREHCTSKAVEVTQHRLEEFLYRLTTKTHVLIVHRRTNEDGSILKTANVLSAAILVDGHDFETKSVARLEAMGGVAYILASIPCPTGVAMPQWPFLTSYIKSDSRSFPVNSTSDKVDWSEVIQRLIASDNESGITLLTQQFVTFVSLAFRKRNWKALEHNSICLIQLQGKPLEYWMLILALEQQGKIEELRSAVLLLDEHYPNIFVTKIAKSLVELDIEVAANYLQAVDVQKMNVYHALGAYGRMCIKSNLDEQGVDAIKLALKQRVSIPADRAILAKHYYDNQKYTEALHTLGSIGENESELSWQSLRLKILVAKQLPDQAITLAQNILQKNPTHQLAIDTLEQFS